MWTMWSLLAAFAICVHEAFSILNIVDRNATQIFISVSSVPNYAEHTDFHVHGLY